MKKSTKYYGLGLVTALCLFINLAASAQELFTVKGVIFKKNTPTTLSFVAVSNASRKTPDGLSDELGSFHIQAAIGDTLVFRRSEYAPQYTVVQTYVNQSVYMTPMIQLDQVTIKETSKKQELQDVLNDYKKKGQFYSSKPSAMSVVASPITGLYELFGKNAANARKFEKYSKEEMERIEIQKRYNKPLVKKITNMPDEDLDSFMLNFTPNVEDIRVWSDYDIVDYIKRHYKYFVENKSSLKLQKLY